MIAGSYPGKYADRNIAGYVDYCQSADNNAAPEPGVPASPDLYRTERGGVA